MRVHPENRGLPNFALLSLEDIKIFTSLYVFLYRPIPHPSCYHHQFRLSYYDSGLKFDLCVCWVGVCTPPEPLSFTKLPLIFKLRRIQLFHFYSLLLYRAKRFFVICSIQHDRKTSMAHFLFLVLWYVSCQSYVHRTKKHPI